MVGMLRNVALVMPKYSWDAKKKNVCKKKNAQRPQKIPPKIPQNPRNVKKVLKMLQKIQKVPKKMQDVPPKF